MEIDEEMNISLQVLVDKGIMNLKDDVREVSEIASKELGFEKIINKMKSEWRNIKFECVLFRDSGTYILRAVEPVLDKLDEDIAKTVSICSSPFVKFLEQEVQQWR